MSTVSFSLYESLTKDEQHTSVPFFEQDTSAVESLDEWELQVPIEENKGGIVAYRRFLREWAAERRTTRTIQHYSEATNPAPWPAYTEPGNLRVVTASGH